MNSSSPSSSKPVVALEIRSRLVVICEDGAVWALDFGKELWHRLPSIPGTNAAGDGRE